MIQYKHISVGTPYLGSVEMPYKFLTGNILDNIKVLIDETIQNYTPTQLSMNFGISQ